MSAQLELLGECPGLPRECTIDPHQPQLPLHVIELLAGPLERCGAQTPGTVRGGQCRATLGITQDAGGRPELCAPQLAHEFRTRRDDDLGAPGDALEVLAQTIMEVTHTYLVSLTM